MWISAWAYKKQLRVLKNLAGRPHAGRSARDFCGRARFNTSARINSKS